MFNSLFTILFATILSFVSTKTIFTSNFSQSVIEECGHRNSINPDISGRIVGGHPAEVGEYPWQVSLQFRYYEYWKFSHFCGGSLIDPSWVLTAAHCVDDFVANNLVVACGKNVLSKKEDNEILMNVKQVIQHENYTRESAENDIALVQLEKPLQLGDFVNIICLPMENQTTDGIITVTGWGATKEDGPISDILMEVDIPVLSEQLCQQEYKPRKVYASMICAGLDEGGEDSCQGDSGGPMISRYHNSTNHYLAGIVSWGYGCAHPLLPGVYTRVSHFRDWIKRFSGV